MEFELGYLVILYQSVHLNPVVQCGYLQPCCLVEKWSGVTGCIKIRMKLTILGITQPHCV